jgi:hypothetical protein
VTSEQVAGVEEQLRRLTKGVQATVDVDGHEVMIVRTGESPGTGRPRYLVACMTCHALLHEMTGDVVGRIDGHLSTQ